MCCLFCLGAAIAASETDPERELRQQRQQQNQPMPPHLDSEGHHHCALTKKEWAEWGERSKAILVLVSLPVIVGPAVHLAMVIWLMTDVGNNPQDYNDSAQLIVTIMLLAGGLICILALAVILLNVFGVRRKRFALLRASRIILILLIVLYLASFIGLILNFDWIGLGIGAASVVWMGITLTLLQRHMKRMLLCKACY
ncbi:unnamed protein product, partial [Mesorhabditis spiculigera]